MIRSLFALFIATTTSLFATTFSKALPIPALASYSVVNGEKVFDMNIHESHTEFFPGVQTKTYGINSSVLGETIRIHNGDKVRINYHNNLAQPTTMHGHGMHVPAIMDGGPINKIQPGTTWSAIYTVDQKASTNWYHPHLMGKTAEHVYMGLAGLIIVDDNESDALNLPKRYGVDDIPLILQDKRFDANGQIDYSPSLMEIRRGYTSNTMLVNGTITPYVNIEAKRIRFRVLNGSNSRVYHLAFSDGRRFFQIATDEAFLEHPVSLSSLVLSPGERAEIVVDFTGEIGTDVILKETADNLDIMKISVSNAPTTTSTLPSTLTSLEIYSAAEAVNTRTFVLNMSGMGMNGHMAINGKTMDLNRIDEVVPVNQVEIWDITNSMGMPHNFHIHATHFYILQRNGSAANVAANEKGYKDVVYMPPNSSARVIVKMKDFTDSNTGYMYHCHFLEHEDDGMMGQFTVVQNSSAPVPDLDGDGLDDVTDSDDDGDGVADSSDAFPRNASESLDTDGDGIGNNADSDDDNDGFTDTEERNAGTDTLDPESHPKRSYIPINMEKGLIIFIPFI